MNILCSETGEVKRYVWHSHWDGDYGTVRRPVLRLDQSWTVCVLPHPAAWMDSGESERRPVAVEMCTTKWIGSRFQLPSRKGKIFSFPRNYLLFRLRAIKYNGSVSAPLSAADVSNPTCTCEEGGER